jgi:hypothetical protein
MVSIRGLLLYVSKSSMPTRSDKSISSTQAEAEKSMEHLCSAVNEVLLYNLELASRLRNMEHIMSSSMSTRTIRTFDTAPSNFPTMSEQQPETMDGYTPGHVESPSIGSNDEANMPTNWPFNTHTWQPALRAFEEQLYQTRVYRQIADRQSLYSFPSDGRTTIAISLSSSLTLGDVSNISVYALPIFVSELSNAQCYESQSHPNATTTQTSEPVPSHLSESQTDGSQAKRFRRALLYWSTRGNEAMPIQSVFGVPLETSIDYAFLDTYTTGANERFKCAVRVPTVVAKCGNSLRGKRLILRLACDSMQKELTRVQ